MAAPPQLGRLGAGLRLDLRPEHQQPSNLRLAIATVVSIGGSLGFDAVLVALGTAVFPSTKGYTHFRFSDYAELTIIGVVLACATWPVVTRICTAPRWLFLRLAVLVTLVLWLPDVWLLARNQPPEAVAVLMVMHLAIAVVTYNALVRLAPVRAAAPVTAGAEAGGRSVDTTPAAAPWTSGRSGWIVMAVAVLLEFAVGVATLLLVPTGRPSGLLPDQGRLIYGVHGLLGVALLVGAVSLVIVHRRGQRFVRIAAVSGLIGVLLAGFGGLLAASHSLRLLGIVLMFGGSMVAGFGYFVGAAEPTGRDEALGGEA